MIVLGIESSCDETGVALVEAAGQGVPRLLSAALHSQIAMHQAYGGVVPELASRDHIRRVIPLTKEALAQANTPHGNFQFFPSNKKINSAQAHSLPLPARVLPLTKGH